MAKPYFYATGGLGLLVWAAVLYCVGIFMIGSALMPRFALGHRSYLSVPSNPDRPEYPPLVERAFDDLTYRIARLDFAAGVALMGIGVMCHRLARTPLALP